MARGWDKALAMSTDWHTCGPIPCEDIESVKQVVAVAGLVGVIHLLTNQRGFYFAVA